MSGNNSLINKKRSINLSIRSFINSDNNERYEILLNILNQKKNNGLMLSSDEIDFMDGYLIYSMQIYDVKAVVITSIILFEDYPGDLMDRVNHFIDIQYRGNGYYGYLNPIVDDITDGNINNTVNTTTAYLRLLKEIVKK